MDKREQYIDKQIIEQIMELRKQLHRIPEHSIKEIADILKISESNVKVRLNRGRTVLRDTLKEAWDYEQSE